MTTRNDLLVLISDVQELNDLSDFMEDEDLTLAIGRCIELVMHPDLTPSAAAILNVKFEALSLTFKMKGRSLMVLPIGKDPAKRKGVYLSLADACHEVAQSLKILAKV